MQPPLVWAEIDLRAITHNIRELRRITHPKARFMAVLKADGYGHGAVEIGRQAIKSGAEMLGVARIDEAIRLREAGFDVPILIFGYTPTACINQLIDFDLRQTLYSKQTAETLSAGAVSRGKKLKIHIKIDTGMGRLGFLPDGFLSAASAQNTPRNAIGEVVAIARLSGLELEGVFTHFAAADSTDRFYTHQQLERFLQFLDQMRAVGLEVPIKHAANSAAIIHLPESHLDMVRAGIALYGLYPAYETEKSLVSLRPAMTLKARVVHLKQVPAGFKVSYGSTYETGNPTTLATVPVGYGDGYSRLLSSRGHMLIHGQRAPIAGRICMDLTVLDVGHIPDVGLEDEVVVVGKQGNESIPADEIASAVHSIHYEIVTSITARVPRRYVR